MRVTWLNRPMPRGNHERYERSKFISARAEKTSPACSATKVLGRPKRCQLAHAFLWEYSYKRLKLAQLLGQLSWRLSRLELVAQQRERAEGGRGDEQRRGEAHLGFGRIVASEKRYRMFQ